MARFTNVHRHSDGSIDFDFYRRRASRRRRLARRRTFRHPLALAKKALNTIPSFVARIADTLLLGAFSRGIARAAVAALILVVAETAFARVPAPPESPPEQASTPGPETADAIFHFGIGG